MKTLSQANQLVVVGAVVALTAAVFFGFTSAPVPPQPEQPRSESGNSPHGQFGDMSVLENLPTDFNDLVTLGNQIMDQQQWVMAAEIYRRALDIDPDAVDVRTDFGVCLNAMGLPHRAIEEFHQVLDVHPEHTTVHFNLGVVFYNQEQMDSARYYFEKYLTLEPNGEAAPSARQILDQM